VNDADFSFLRDFVRRRSGLALGPEKRYLVESRLQPLARAAGIPGLSSVVAMLRSGRDEAFARSVVDAMATHETMFFRDRVPFEILRDIVLPQLAALRLTRPLRIWSAATSTGQEAYSLAMLVREMGGVLGHRPVDIVASDMAESAISRAKTGIYSQFEVQRGLPIRNLLQHFVQTAGGWQIRPELRRMVSFRVFNLLDDLAPLGQFDVILCRNILIYLDQPTKETLLAKLSAALAPDGVLCLGGPESALGLTNTLVSHPQAAGFLQRGDRSRKNGLAALSDTATLPARASLAPRAASR
jgi:chemotaxis protein methyltransferase CheR